MHSGARRRGDQSNGFGKGRQGFFMRFVKEAFRRKLRFQFFKSELQGTGAVITHSSWRNVEIMSQGMGKATALRWLASHLGIDLKDCMAFGDNDNDMDMLQAVGWPVAMGNADGALKAMARIVADDDVNDGVAKVIFEKVLGEDRP